MTTEQIAMIAAVASVFNSVGVLLIVLFLYRMTHSIRNTSGYELARQIALLSADLKQTRAQLVGIPRIESELRLLHAFKEEQQQKNRIHSEVSEAMLRMIRDIEARIETQQP